MSRKKATREEVEYRTLCANVRELVKLRQGREVIWHILGMCNVYSDSFSGNSRTFYEEGKRSVGLDIMHLLSDADPFIYPSMLADKAKEAQAENEIQESKNAR